MEPPCLFASRAAEPSPLGSFQSTFQLGRRVKKQLTPLKTRGLSHCSSAGNTSVTLDTTCVNAFKHKGLCRSSSAATIPTQADTSSKERPYNKAGLPPLLLGNVGRLPSLVGKMEPRKLPCSMQKAAPEVTSQFELVKEFNHAFGLNTASKPRHDLFDVEPKVAERCLKLVLEEAHELEEGFSKKSLTEVTDALADLLYVVYNAGATFGIDLDAAFDIVHKSNMTKLCATEDEAKATVEWYKLNLAKRYDSPAYRPANDGKHWVVFNESTGKPLKSVNWLEPDFAALGI